MASCAEQSSYPQWETSDDSPRLLSPTCWFIHVYTSRALIRLHTPSEWLQSLRGNVSWDTGRSVLLNQFVTVELYQCGAYLLLQESLAKAKTSARQQRMYEVPYRRNQRQMKVRNTMLKNAFSNLQRCRWLLSATTLSWSIVIRLAVVETEICEIPRNSLKIRAYTVQAYPTSSILVSIESAYATSY